MCVFCSRICHLKLVAQVFDGTNIASHNFFLLYLFAAVGQPNQGVVVISEFVSSARVMRGALNVNPWRVQEVMFGSVLVYFWFFSHVPVYLFLVPVCKDSMCHRFT